MTNSGKVPGSFAEKVWYYIWYEVIMGIWMGFLALRNQLFQSLDKVNYTALPKRSGQTAVLTGGTRGIGLKVLTKLLQLDYHVVLGVRNINAGLKAIKDIRLEGVKTGSAKCIPLDLKSLKSVRSFAQIVLKEVDQIDLLVNNAGVMLEPYHLTEDGFEAHFQVNYLSHYLLTQRLLPKMKSTASRKSTNCRVVNVSSVAHNVASATDINDASNPKVYSALRAYANSKLCQILFTKYQDSLLKSEGVNINIYAVHPGAIITDLYVNVVFREFLLHCLRMIFRRSTDDGAEVVMHAAISPELEGHGGLYIINRQKSKPSSVAEDLTLQKLLWDLSKGFVGM